MDEHYGFFLKNFSPVIERHEVPLSSIQRYRNKLPEQLIEYWKDYGWCGYADGLFWTVNPQDYEHILNQWLTDAGLIRQDNYYVIARSAFGVVYVWGERSGYCLTVTAYMSRFSTRTSIFSEGKLDFGVKAFFASMSAEHNDLEHLFKPAVDTLGKLKGDEMYGFVPALALGGSIDLQNLQKVKAIEHLEFLSQVSPLQNWGFPEF
ncbi:GAD-like domain-containing protein [Pseudomonas sp. UM16]|uniref:GAD-like domain-containing protein n=1 Tax=Pseudomonas sp. UM16 TaxID=3158962 RepID=UPI00398FBDDE